MPEIQTRRGTFKPSSDKASTFEASLSSEQPYQRMFGLEVLEHSEAAVDLSRATQGLPLLLNHNPDQIVGRVDQVRRDGRRLIGTLRFFDTDAGRDAGAMLRGGHREISIGYQILKYVNERQGEAEVARVTRWALLEASIVAVPADASIGVNRSAALKFPERKNQMDSEIEVQTGADTHQTRSQRRASSQSLDQERERVANIQALAARFPKALTADQVRAACSGGEAYDVVRERVFASMESSAPLQLADANEVQRAASWGGSDGMPREIRDWNDVCAGFSLSRAVQAQVDPSKFLRSAGREAEISQELGRRSSVPLQGTLVPVSAIFGREMQMAARSLTVGVGSAGGSTVQTSIDSALFADVLRARTIVAALGARVLVGLTGNLVIPRKTSAAVAGWVTETGAVGSTDPAFDQVTLQPRRIGAFTDVSKQLAIQSSLEMEHVVRDDLSQTILVEIDRVALLGTGSANQPRGILNTSGIGSVAGGTNGAQITWAHILDLEKAVAGANALINLTGCGYAINPFSRAFMKRTPKTAATGSELIIGDQPADLRGLSSLNGYRCGTSTLLPSNGTKGTSAGVCSSLIFGDFSQLFVGLFEGGIELIVDPYTLATTGQIRITANLFADIALRYAQSFAAMTDALTT